MSGSDHSKRPLTRAQRFVRSLSKWMPVAFISIILVLLYFGIADLRVLAANSPADATMTAAQLKDKIDELRWILELILAAAGLFTIAQGIAAGFSATSFSDQAERLISNAEKQTERLIANAKERLSAFTMLEARMRDADANRANLEHSLASNSPIHDADEGFNWKRRLYEDIPLETRHKLLSTEEFIPYRISGENDPLPAYERMLRYLAQFYWAKFVYERKFGPGQLEDLERAEHHLDLAIRRAGQSFFLLNDMGNIQIEYYKALSQSGRSGPEFEALLKRFKDRAVDCFKQSICVQKEHLRAYYNLAFVEADLPPAQERGALERAIKQLLEGLKYPNWERKPVPEYMCNAYYNVACYNGRLLATKLLKDIGDRQRKEIVPKIRANCQEALKEAAKIGMISPTQVEEDFNLDSGDIKGDLYWFVHTEALTDDQGLSQIKHDLSSSYKA